MPILIEVLISLIAALLSLAGSSFVLNARAERVLKKAVRKILGLPPQEEPPSYSDRLEKLTSSLIKASREMDGLLHELADVARERQENIGENRCGPSTNARP